MRVQAGWLGQIVAGGLMCFLVVPYGAAATRDLPSAPQPSRNVMAVPVEASPEFTASSMTIAENSPHGMDIALQTPGNDQSRQSSTDQQSPASDRQTTSQPAGTAAAPAVNARGVPGSRPAGAAIAPAKQRRIRTVAIRIGLLVGAAVAVGTITALSLGSPSRPN